jgi:hypothetical protein
LDQVFKLQYENGVTTIKPKIDALQAFNTEARRNLEMLLLPSIKRKIPSNAKKNDRKKMILIFSQHRLLQSFNSRII